MYAIIDKAEKLRRAAEKVDKEKVKSVSNSRNTKSIEINRSIGATGPDSSNGDLCPKNFIQGRGIDRAATATGHNRHLNVNSSMGR